MSERQAVTKKLVQRYKRASKAEKSRILDELVELTGWHRDHVRAQLRRPPVPRLAAVRAPRASKFSPSVLAALVVVWKLTRYPAGKRLAPMLAVVVPLLRRDGVLDIDDETATVLVAMSAASIDRHLAPERVKFDLRGRSHTKPGTLLKHQIPIRTWRDWDENSPGFVEIDLVGHEGGNSSGEFCFTLTMTDVATGWTVNRSVKNKAAIWVVEAIEAAAQLFPFPIYGIDSDNGSEFINAHLLAYCEARTITFTRSRSGNKNDGAYVEQKNWTHVRRLVGYLRFDTDAELAVLNQIWALDHLFTNHLLAQTKLIEKHRNGAKVTKRYDRAQTPAQRLAVHPKAPEGIGAFLDQTLADLHPTVIQEGIDDLLQQLERLSIFKPQAPVRPRVNRAFNNPPHPQILGEATNQASRRF